MAPRLYGYYNANNTPLKAFADSAYTDIVLAFAFTDTPGTPLEISGNLYPSLLAEIPDVKAAGKRVHLSLGGGTMNSEVWKYLSENIDQTTEQLVSLVAQHNLDGVDIDYEDNTALAGNGDYDAVTFMVALTNALYDALPASAKHITHAPQSPYLNPNWGGGPYVEVMKQVGEKIDALLIQYYNQGDGYQFPLDRCVVGSTPNPTAWSIGGLVDRGVARPEQLAVGTIIAKNDGMDKSYVSPEDIHSKIVTPLQQRFGDTFGGVMGWQLRSDPDGQWAKTVLGG